MWISFCLDIKEILRGNIIKGVGYGHWQYKGTDKKY